MEVMDVVDRVDHVQLDNSVVVQQERVVDVYVSVLERHVEVMVVGDSVEHVELVHSVRLLDNVLLILLLATS